MTLKRSPAQKALALASALTLLPLGTGLAAPVWAQSGPSQAPSAQTGETQSYDIPAGPLNQVLGRFASESGLLLSADGRLTRGLQSDGLQGEYSIEQALQQLLAGTGLNYRLAEDDTVTLVERSPNNGPLQLAPIQVGADAGGFRAETSSSATNVDAPLIETPATVNVLTEDFLRVTKPRRLEDTLAYVPGAGQEITLGNSDPIFSLRGFSSTGREGGLFVDGYQLIRRSYVPDPALYERIDILKGTSGVLYGTARPGGIINLIPKEPQFSQAKTSITAIGGSFDTARLEVDSTGPIGKSAAYRTIFLRQEANQTLHGQNDSGLQDDRTIFNGKIAWKTPTGGELQLGYEYYFIDQAFDPGIQFINGEWTFNRDPLTNPDQFSDREFNTFSADFNQPLTNDWNLHVGGRYVTGDTKRFLDASVTGPLDGSAVSRFTDRAVEDYEQQEVLAELKGDVRTGPISHEISFGANYFETDLDRGRAVVFQSGVIDPFNPNFSNPPAFPTPSPNDPEEAQDFEQTRLFFQDYATLGPVKLIAGVSFIDFELTDGSENVDDSEADFFIGGVYNYNSWFNPFVAYSTSTQPQLGNREEGGTLPPRDAEQIEFGIKGEWFEGHLRSAISVFEIEQSDKAEASPTNPDAFRLSGDEKVRGAELEVTGELVNGVTAQIGWSYLDAEFSESIDAGLEDNRLPNIPEHKISALIKHNNVAGINGLEIGAGVVRVMDRKAGNDNEVDIPDFTRGDVFIGYRRGSWSIDATVENITDKDYVLGTRPGFPDPDGTFQAAQGTPRFLTVGVSYEF